MNNNNDKGTIRPSLIEEAVRLAVDAHYGQRDLAGAPYILHPLRLMHGMKTEEEQTVAVLHDVLEDAKDPEIRSRVQALLYGHAPAESATRMYEALVALTRVQGESYKEFIERIAPVSLARRVKLADLGDNMNRNRIDTPTDRDFRRWAKYKKAQATLLAAEAPPEGIKNVHTEHCCAVHGCKYGDEACSVARKVQRQSFPCENCTPDETVGT